MRKEQPANKINHISPELLPTDQCWVCKHPSENEHHFLIWSPLKRQVWSLVWQNLFNVPPSFYMILRIITKCEKAQTHYLPIKKLLQICAHILLAIWKAHWAYIFHDKPFIATIVANTVLHAITTHTPITT